jgi:hypothetical protein
MVACQILLILFNAVAGGSYFRWDSFPTHWEWLSSWSLFDAAAKAILIALYNELTFSCQLTAGECISYDGEQYTCGAVSGDKCEVAGRHVLSVDKGVDESETMTDPLSVLLALIIGFRFLEYVLMNYSVEEILFEYPKSYGENEMRVGIMALRSYELITHTIEQSTQNGVSAMHPDPSEYALSQKGSGQGPSIRRKGVSSKRPDSASYKIVNGGMVRGDTVKMVSSTLVWKGVTMVTKIGNKKLTENLYGHVTTGTILSIMSPSGAGEYAF